MTALRIAGLIVLAAVLAVGGYLLLSDDEGPLLPGGAATESPTQEEGFGLEQNQPNPFQDVTAIIYQLPRRERATITIYNTLGAPVLTLVDEEQDAGFHQVQWDGKDRNRNRLTGGVYFYQLTAGDRQALRRLVLLP